ncbi:hypothetical protein BGX21_000639 [Mortierella sp. AD011]|nr:hypothetical protein BGX20_003961 [Mortierella sp. AD010]KAF9387177.1 hypothetical protein BGX21_000639 [Mortierella sp. AD011]
MFIPLPIFVNSIILTIFRLTLTAALGAALSISSKFGDEQVNSIRWIQEGGFLGMLKSLLPSRKAPRSVKAAMVFVFLASLVANHLDKGLSKLITPATTLGKPDYVVTETPMFFKANFIDTFSEWSTSIRVGDGIVDAMVSIMNDTRNIVNAESGRLYTPRTSPYEIGCNQLVIQFMNTSTDWVSLHNDGCMNLSFVLGTDAAVYFDIAATQFVKRAPGRWSVVIPRSSDLNFQQMDIYPGVSDGNSMFFGGLIGAYKPITLVDGIAVTPRTVATECFSSSGGFWIISSTSVLFSMTTVKQFRNSTSAIFEEYGELLQAMESSVSNITFPSMPVAIVELKVVNTTVDSLICYSGNSTTVGEIALSCVYSSIYIIITKPLDTNPIISDAGEGRYLPYPDLYLSNVAMTIDHIPTILNRTRLPISFTDMKATSSAASGYLASISPSVYMDWNQFTLYSLFDTMDIVNGFEIPTWLFVFLIATIVLCFAFWGAVKYKMDEGYMGSLHKNIAMVISARKGWHKPMLMRFNANPLTFEDYPIVPGIHVVLSEDNSSSSPLNTEAQQAMNNNFEL